MPPALRPLLACLLPLVSGCVTINVYPGSGGPGSPGAGPAAGGYATPAVGQPGYGAGPAYVGGATGYAPPGAPPAHSIDTNWPPGPAPQANGLHAPAIVSPQTPSGRPIGNDL